MTRDDFVRAIAKASGEEIQRVKELEQVYLEVLVEAVRRGELVHVPSFGIWYLKRTKARRVSNLSRPGELLRLPAQETVGFRASSVLRRRQ